MTESHLAKPFVPRWPHGAVCSNWTRVCCNTVQCGPCIVQVTRSGDMSSSNRPSCYKFTWRAQRQLTEWASHALSRGLARCEPHVHVLMSCHRLRVMQPSQPAACCDRLARTRRHLNRPHWLTHLVRTVYAKVSLLAHVYAVLPTAESTDRLVNARPHILSPSWNTDNYPGHEYMRWLNGDNFLPAKTTPAQRGYAWPSSRDRI